MLRLQRILHQNHLVNRYLFQLGGASKSAANLCYKVVSFPRNLHSEATAKNKGVISLDTEDKQHSNRTPPTVESAINIKSTLKVESTGKGSAVATEMRKIQKRRSKSQKFSQTKETDQGVLKVLKKSNIVNNSSNGVFKSAKVLSQDMSSYYRLNKKGAHPLEEDNVLSPEESVSLVQFKEFNLLSIDIEMYERKTSEITEIGISVYNPRYQKSALFPHIVCFHLIIKEFIKHRNGRFVPDAKKNNLTGISTVVTLSQAKGMVSSLLNRLGPKTVIVGHGVQGDLRLLRKHGFPFPRPLQIIDTQKLWNNMYVGKSHKSSLGYILDKLGIPHSFLHNGANDSYYTLVACLMLCSPDLMSNIITRKTVPRKISERERNALLEQGADLPLETAITVKCGVSEADIKAKKGHSHSAKSNYFYPWHNYNEKEVTQKLDDLLKD